MTLMKIARAVVANPAFITKDITGDGRPETFCNWGLRIIANIAFDFDGFNDKSANQITEMVRSNPAEWSKVDVLGAATAAQNGKMCVAVQSAQVGSGHVAFVVPGSPVRAGKWSEMQKKPVFAPMVANVGKQNGIMSANFAFGSEPEYYVFRNR